MIHVISFILLIVYKLNKIIAGAVFMTLLRAFQAVLGIILVKYAMILIVSY